MACIPNLLKISILPVLDINGNIWLHNICLYFTKTDIDGMLGHW